MNANILIEKLGLIPLPEEGGFYRETYRSKYKVIDGNNVKVAGTAIYYLITPLQFSALHRIKYDEIFHFYAGDTAEMIQINGDKQLKMIELGNPLLGLQCQVVVPAGSWQGLRLKDGGSWALLGTTVAPGFEFSDFDIKTRLELINLFPSHSKEIEKYTRC